MKAGFGIGEAGQDEAEGQGRLLAALGHVDVRVGAVADDEIAALDHALGDVAVQVERDDDFAFRAGELAGERDDLAVGIVAVGGDHGAVVGDVDGVEGAGLRETRRA